MSWSILFIAEVPKRSPSLDLARCGLILGIEWEPVLPFSYVAFTFTPQCGILLLTNILSHLDWYLVPMSNAWIHWHLTNLSSFDSQDSGTAKAYFLHSWLMVLKLLNNLHYFLFYIYLGSDLFFLLSVCETETPNWLLLIFYKCQ